MASNLTLSFPGNHKISVDGKLKFPPPNNETHEITGRLDGGRNMDDIKYLINYQTLLSGLRYGSSGNVSIFLPLRFLQLLYAGWSDPPCILFPSICTS